MKVSETSFISSQVNDNILVSSIKVDALFNKWHHFQDNLNTIYPN